MIGNMASGVRGSAGAVVLVCALIATSAVAAAPRSQIRDGRVHVQLQDAEGKEHRPRKG